MSYQANFTGWQYLTLEDLLEAYRKAKDDAGNGHTHFSNPNRAFENLIKNNDPTPEFRIVGDFSLVRSRLGKALACPMKPSLLCWARHYRSFAQLTR
jgi:hypothetical protein